MIIPDTSIWIEFFKVSEPFSTRLSQLIENKQVAVIEPIFAEIIYGVRRTRDKKLIESYWDILPKLSFGTGSMVSAAQYANTNNYQNLGVGLMDATILLPIISEGHQLWTLDKKMLRTLPIESIFE